MTPDQVKALTTLQQATREVHHAYDEIARLAVRLADRESAITELKAHIARLQDILLHEGRPEPACHQQRTGDSTI